MRSDELGPRGVRPPAPLAERGSFWVGHSRLSSMSRRPKQTQRLFPDQRDSPRSFSAPRPRGVDRPCRILCHLQTADTADCLTGALRGSRDDVGCR